MVPVDAFFVYPGDVVLVTTRGDLAERWASIQTGERSSFWRSCSRSVRQDRAQSDKTVLSPTRPCSCSTGDDRNVSYICHFCRARHET